MSEYDDLLIQARTKAEAFRSSAREFIPKMYKALRRENENISPSDARDRIQKDCVGIWSKRTILDALPDEAKDKEKQKAGRLSQKKDNSAAFSAASDQDEDIKKKIVIDVQGIPVEEKKLELTSSPSDICFPTTDDNNSITNTIGISLKPDQKGFDKQIKPNLECPSCKELYPENLELKEALEKATQLITANNMVSTSPGIASSTDYNHADDILEFEFPLLVEDVRKYIVAINSKTSDGNNAWFSGRIDKKTGRVISARTGKIGRPKIDFGDSHSIGDV